MAACNSANCHIIAYIFSSIGNQASKRNSTERRTANTLHKQARRPEKSKIRPSEQGVPRDQQMMVLDLTSLGTFAFYRIFCKVAYGGSKKQGVPPFPYLVLTSDELPSLMTCAPMKFITWHECRSQIYQFYFICYSILMKRSTTVEVKTRCTIFSIFWY